jgi:xylitol oxidase
VTPLDAGATWAGTHRFTAPQLVEATSIAQVQAVVRAGGRVRALGTRHSFTDLADTTGTLVTVLGLPARPVLDEPARTVTVGAGTMYGVLADWLQQRGWALHNLGSLPHISIGGATATGTHGSGIANGSLATAVAAIEFVDASGNLVTVSRADPDFAGYVVGLGGYGVVVRLTLDIEPTFQVRQDVYRGLPWDVVLADFDVVAAAAYSVSLFTDWCGPTLEQSWLKTRLGDGPGEMPATWLGAVRSSRSDARLVEATSDNLTAQAGRPGPWSQRLPHFRFDTGPSNGNEIQSEYFVDRRDAAGALTALRDLGDRLAPYLLVSELRTVAADELWLSPAYARNTLAIHFTWRNRPDAVRAILVDVEQVLADFDPRPHWGKFHRLDAARIAARYPRFAQAVDLFERLDPAGTFSNAHLERLGLRRSR